MQLVKQLLYNNVKVNVFSELKYEVPDMVMDFLKKYQEELIAEKIELKEDYDLLLSKIKENEKFLKMLEDESSALFSDFTPREVSYKHKDKITEVQSILDGLKNDKLSMEVKLSHIKERLSEIETIIDSMNSKNDADGSSVKYVIDSKDSSKIKHNLQNIAGYILSDPTRASIELQHIISEL